ncbi:MAG: amidohydrolase family protein [Cyanobacteria bacterium REEB65]|nr:amidohydrolase family protein [Cyanobacteria bacterium REEB65]
MNRRIDIHVHLAGVGHGGTGCSVSKRMARSLRFAFLKRAAGLARPRSDRHYADRLIQYVEDSREVDYACVFALDGVYGESGDFRPDLSHLYVPNSYAIEVCERSPRLIPVISVNPQRKDALEELATWGPRAVALKWLPPLQRFDPSAARFTAFRQLLKELGLPVICHSGNEHTFPGAVQPLGNPELCEPLLKLGIPVIFAHCGTCSFLSPGLDFVRGFDRLLDRYDCAFGDTAGFVSLFRAHRLKHFAAERYAGRILHGSDYPVPVSSLYYLGQLGWSAVRELERSTNPIDKDAAIKRAVGMPDAVFTAAWDLLGERISKLKGLPES